MVVGADACHLYVLLKDALVLELKPAALPQVDVPLRIATGYLIHRVTSCSKLLVDLVAHLEILQRDTGADDGLQLLGARMIGHLHRGDGNACYVGHRAPPAAMHHAGGMMLGVVKDDGDAVGGRNSDTDAGNVRHQGIDTFEHLATHLFLQPEEGMADLGNARGMHLMGHHQAIGADLQQSAEGLAVLSDILGIVATIGIDIELAISPLTAAPMTGGTEGGDALSEVVKGELGL